MLRFQIGLIDAVVEDPVLDRIVVDIFDIHRYITHTQKLD
jgi:hypothetical protein